MLNNIGNIADSSDNKKDGSAIHAAFPFFVPPYYNIYCLFIIIGMPTSYHCQIQMDKNII